MSTIQRARAPFGVFLLSLTTTASCIPGAPPKATATGGFASLGLELDAAGIPPGNSTDPMWFFDVQTAAQLKALPLFASGDVKFGVKATPGTPIYVGAGKFKAGKPDPQISLQSTKDAGSGFVGLDRKFTGAYDFRATVTVDKKPYPVDGVTRGYIQVATPAIGPGDALQGFVRVEALRNEAIGGFVVRAYDGEGEIGTAKNFSGSKRIDLRIERTDLTLTITARPTPNDPTSAFGWTEVHGDAVALDPVAVHSVQFGVEGLAKNKRVYFDTFKLDGPGVAGAAEQPIVVELNAAMASLANAVTLLKGNPPDFFGAGELVNAAVELLTQAKQGIAQAESDQFLQPSTASSLALDRIDGALKFVDKFSKGLVGESIPKGKAKSMANHLDNARWQIKGAIANMAGSNAKNPKTVPYVVKTPTQGF